MISYAPIDEIIKRPSPPIVQKTVKSDKVQDDDEIETECYYVTVVFMLCIIVLMTTDMIKK